MEGADADAWRNNKVLLGILGLLVLIHLFKMGQADELAAFQTYPDRIEGAWRSLREGDFSWSSFSIFVTLLSGAMLHADAMHLLGNMLFLWIFGALVKELQGNFWLVVIYLSGSVAGAVGDVLLRQGSAIPSLGASGAVMALEGAYLGMAVRWRLPDPYIWPMSYPIPPLQLAALACLGFFLDFSGVIGGSVGVAYGAHLGGFVMGLFLTSLVAGKPKV